MPTFSNITKSRNLFSEIHFALCEKRTAHGNGLLLPCAETKRKVHGYSRALRSCKMKYNIAS